MATETWGLLPKNQEDPEKIEEAIARMIKEHEEDEEAHLGPGESLQSHKASEIIDHLIGSIVADKFAYKQVICQTVFESIDGWVSSGLAPELLWPGVLIHCGGTLNAESWLYVGGSEVFFTSDFQKNFLFQTTVNIRTSKKELVRIYVGQILASEDGVGIGFETSDNKLIGVFKNWGNRYTVELMTTPNYQDLVLRIQVFSTEGKIKYYVNGVLKGSLDLEEISEGWDLGPNYMIKNAVAGTDATLTITNLMLSKDI